MSTCLQGPPTEYAYVLAREILRKRGLNDLDRVSQKEGNRFGSVARLWRFVAGGVADASMATSSAPQLRSVNSECHLRQSCVALPVDSSCSNP